MFPGVLFLLLVALLGDVFGQSSSENLARAEEGVADQSWPKRPGNEVSAFAGKMANYKQIEVKNYGKEKSFQAPQIYQDRRDANLEPTPLWTKGTSAYQSKESVWSDSKGSDSEELWKREFVMRRETTWQNKNQHEARDVLAGQKGVTDWASRVNSKFHGKEGSLIMYEGRLIRVRETVASQDHSAGRDLGDGRKEIFQPHEVRKILEGKRRSDSSEKPSPFEGALKAESGEAFQPLVADSLLSSP